jgi:hypothetical protein
VTFVLKEAPRRPLPAIQRRIRDELLSSWLARCAHFYGTSADQLIDHMGIVWMPCPGQSALAGSGAERKLDFRPTPLIVRRIAWCLHTRASIIAKHTHPVDLSDLGSESFVKIIGTPLSCRYCRRDFAAAECPPRIKSWFEPWRVQCGRCLRPFNARCQSRSARHEQRLYGPQNIPFRLWRDAVRGGDIIDRWHRRQPCGLLPPNWVMRILKQPLNYQYGPHNSRLLSVLVPEAAHGAFWPRQFRIDLSAATLPVRISILAGITRFNDGAQTTLSELSARTTSAGRKAIADLLNALPNAIANELRGNHLQKAARQHGALSVHAHTLSRELDVNLRQIGHICRELASRPRLGTP